MKIAALTAIALYVGTLMDAAYSQQRQCGSHDRLVNYLEKRYNEVQVAVGMVGNDRIMEFFASKDKTWTVIVSNAKGVSCIIAAGTDVEHLEPKFDEVDPKS